MDFFGPEFLSALLAIIVIDLVLAGDNAIVIAMAARNLPPHLQKKAIIWGAVGAIAVRSFMTLIVVYLLGIPGLMFIGGALLVWIAYKLLKPAANEGAGQDHAANTFWGAMKTIVIADAVMGLDNVLAVAGAAGGSYLLVVIGLLISIPIVVWGSTLILKLVDRYPSIIYFGAAVLAFTAGKMMTSEPMVQAWLDSVSMSLEYVVQAVVILGVLVAGYAQSKVSPKKSAAV
ncbi:TerC family protein [Polynucleobacter antarcticus]|uniref:TerC family protein n=1 Tax=Polynucleobacter antarcticus TaxID=1743162 RepID=UPI0020C5DB02|nr:TerC family protein [Polynucleobacter antarcticus]